MPTTTDLPTTIVLKTWDQQSTTAERLCADILRLNGFKDVDPHDYKVPDFEDSLEIDRPGFVFKGWVQDGSGERALDEHDWWAAGIH